MSKPRYKWWGYVRAVIRAYPELKSRLDQLHTPSVTAAYRAMPRSGAGGRVTEQIALRGLSRQEQREYDAVRLAISRARTQSSGQERLRLIDMVFWSGRLRLFEAADRIPCSQATARRWQGDFIRAVAVNLGLLGENRKNDTRKPF